MFVCKRAKINEKEAGDEPFLKKISRTWESFIEMNDDWLPFRQEYLGPERMLL